MNIPKKYKSPKKFLIKSAANKYFNGLLSLENQDKNWTNSTKRARKMTRETAQRKIDLYKHFFSGCSVCDADFE